MGTPDYRISKSFTGEDVTTLMECPLFVEYDFFVEASLSSSGTLPSVHPFFTTRFLGQFAAPSSVSLEMGTNEKELSRITPYLHDEGLSGSGPIDF